MLDYSKQGNTDLIRVGVFYDGNYFLHVSNYYNYIHPRRSRLSISGLHDFIRFQVAVEEETDIRLCQIVDAHYFRGRLSAQEASQRGNQLYYERIFDDILMSEGVITHYLPVKLVNGYRQEKGIDVWFALEAFELAFYKKFNVLVLIAADGDYVPLVRKLNSIGTKVMVLSWDFEFTNAEGLRMTTRTSQDLLHETSYPVDMHESIERGLMENDALIEGLFAYQAAQNQDVFENVEEPKEASDVKTSIIHSLKNGYGFIKYPPNNIFFHYTSLVDHDFNDLREGDAVEFIIETTEEGGQPIAKEVRLIVD